MNNILSDLGVDPVKKLTKSEVSKMSDHELKMMRFIELDPDEEEIVIAEMIKRGFGEE